MEDFVLKNTQQISMQFCFGGGH